MAATISEGLAALNNANLSKLQKNLDALKIQTATSGSASGELNIDEEIVRKKILPIIEKVMKLKK